MTDSVEPRRQRTILQESAFPVTLSQMDVIGLFWKEMKLLLPASELHVIDPYALDAGGKRPDQYAANFVALLKTVLVTVERATIIYSKEREGVRALIEQDARMMNPDLTIEYRRGSGLHARYIIADRERISRMEFSFNRIGDSFGTVSLVTDPDDVAGILAELERLDPAAAG